MKKQSNYFNGLWEVRLLRSARNDSLFEFLRDYQKCLPPGSGVRKPIPFSLLMNSLRLQGSSTELDSRLFKRGPLFV